VLLEISLIVAATCDCEIILEYVPRQTVLFFSPSLRYRNPAFDNLRKLANIIVLSW